MVTRYQPWWLIRVQPSKAVMNIQSRSLSKLSFLVQELLVLAWSASVQRASVYAPGNPARRAAATGRFRRQLLAFVEQSLIPAYVEGSTEEQHLANLLQLQQTGTALGADLLDGAVYRIGVSQKFLNLLLKYLWALDLIPEPPHCPVDRVVIDMSAEPIALNWTEMTTVEQYMSAIAALKRDAAKRNLSLAQWELLHYARRSPLRLDLERLTNLASRAAG
jgi:hypothetical protein